MHFQRYFTAFHASFHDRFIASSLADALRSSIHGERSELEGLRQKTYVVSTKKWIVSDPEHLGGNPRVRDTRIPVSLALESLAAGISVVEIVDAYPSLTEEPVRGVLHEASEPSLSPISSLYFG